MNEDDIVVAGTEDDIATRLNANSLTLGKKTNIKAEQSYFSPNPSEFIE